MIGGDGIAQRVQKFICQTVMRCDDIEKIALGHPSHSQNEIDGGIVAEVERAVFPACNTDHVAIEPRRRLLVDLEFPAQEMFPRLERGEVEERQTDRLFQLPHGIAADEDGGDMGLPGRAAGQFGQEPRNVLLFAWNCHGGGK